MKQIKPSQKDANGTSFLRATLKTPFEVPHGRLVVRAMAKGFEVLGLPIENWEHLCLDKDGRSYRIDSLRQLRDHVKIGSPEQALAFVRLLTSLSTFYLFNRAGGECAIDLIDRSKIGEYFQYGGSHDYQKLPDGFWGIVDHRTYRALGIPDVSARRTPDGFVLQRPLVKFVRPHSGSYRVSDAYLLRELVRLNGDVVEMGRQSLSKHVVSRVDWSLPMYE